MADVSEIGDRPRRRRRRKQADESLTISEIDDDTALVERFHKWFRDAHEAQHDWLERYAENCRMLSNEQWPQEVKRARESAGRPCLVFNMMLKNVLTIIGIQTRGREEPKLLPQEPEDAAAANLMGVILKYVRDQAKAKRHDTKVFTDKAHSGLGWWKVWVDFDSRPNGEIRIDRSSPLTITPDPNWIEDGWPRAQYVFENQWMTLDEAIESFPDFEDRIRSTFGAWQKKPHFVEIPNGPKDKDADRRMFWDHETQRIRVLDLWYFKRVQVDVAVNPETNEVIEGDEVESLQRDIDFERETHGIEQEGLPKEERTEFETPWTFTTRRVPVVHLAQMLDDVLLSNEPGPYRKQVLPLFPSMGYQFIGSPFGLVDVMKDAQVEKNKRRSAIAEILARSPKGGFFNKNVGGADPTVLEDFASGYGVNIGYDTEIPKQISPPAIDQNSVMLEQLASREINDTVNVNAELLGQTTQTTVSGRAIEARQQGGVLTHAHLFDTFQDEQTDVTEFVLDLIQEYITPEEAFRVLGALARREPDSPLTQRALESVPNAAEFDRIFTRALSTRFDVVVSSKAFDATHQMAEAQVVLDLAGQYEIPLQVVVEAQRRAGLLSDETASDLISSQQQAPDEQALAEQAGLGGGAPIDQLF